MGVGEEGRSEGAFLLAVSHHLCKKHPHGVGCLEEGNASHIPVLYYASHVGGLLLSCGRRPLFFLFNRECLDNLKNSCLPSSI